MPAPTWTPLPTFRLPQGLITKPWLLVLEEPRATEASHLKIQVTGAWTPTGGSLSRCDPDGLLGAPMQTDKLAVTNCPLGAVLGKFGGSSASFVPPATDGGSLSEGQSFVIGSFCVVAIPDKSFGPLFLSFNGLIRPIAVAEEIVVTIAGSTPTL